VAPAGIVQRLNFSVALFQILRMARGVMLGRKGDAAPSIACSAGSRAYNLRLRNAPLQKQPIEEAV